MLTEKEYQKIEEFVKKELGDNYDLFDCYAEIDNSLKYPEAMNEIAEKISILKQDLKEQAKSLKNQEEKHTKQSKDFLKNYLDNNIKSIGLDSLFKKYRVIGVCGNQNSAKSLLSLFKLIELKRKYNLNIYVFGVEGVLHNVLIKKGIKIIHNKEDILDLKIKNSIIYVDEFADFFSVQTKDKQLERVRRFFNRIHHLNNWFIISTAQAGFWNKFMNGIVNCYLVKEIEYDNLVNGTVLKRKIMGLPSTSDYRFECPKGTYYIINDDITERCKFPYIKELDSKKHLTNPFLKQKVKKKDD